MAKRNTSEESNKLEISAQEAKKKLAKKEVILVDIRTPREREVAVIETSLFIPMEEALKRLDELPKNKQLILYCHHGNRSLFAARILESKGYNVKSLSGGIDKWAREIDRSIATY